MRILATSDLHGNLPYEIEPCDLLLIGGDILPVWDHTRSFQLEWINGAFTEWALDVLERIAKHIVVIAGNHDFVIEDSYGDDAMRKIHPNVHYLCDEAVEIEGVKIYGMPWSPNLPKWAFQAEGKDAEEKYAAIPEGTDILVTHGPPKGLGDKCDYQKASESTPHVGSVELLNAIEEKKIPAIVTGHIHEAAGIYEYGDSTIYNVSFVDRNYNPKNPIVEVVLPNASVESDSDTTDG